MSGYVDHAWRHRPKALGGTDPIEVGSSLIPLAIKFNAWAHQVGTGTGFDIDDLFDFNGHYLSNDPDETYFSDFADTTLGYSREAIEIHAPGLYLMEWSVTFGFPASGGPQYLRAVPGPVTDLIDGVSIQGAGKTGGYELLVPSASYPGTRGINLGGLAFELISDDTPVRYPLSLKSLDGTANWDIHTGVMRIARLGDFGTLA